MQRWLLLCLVATAIGCGNSYPAVRQEGSISTITYPMAFGNYSRVYNTTYHIVNRYAVVRNASYKRGVIEAELSQNTQLFEKTRRTVLARLFDTGDYWDVECRVLIEVEDSDVETLGKFQPRYKWRVVGYDQFLETRLNNEIKAALTGGAWQTKAPLKYQGVASRMKKRRGVQFDGAKAVPSSHSQVKKSEAKAVLQQINDLQREPRSEKQTVSQSIHKADPNASVNAREYERDGVQLLQKGDYRKARSAFNSALQVNPKSVSANFLLAHTHFATMQYSQSAAALKRGMNSVADWHNADIDLRSFYLEASQYQKHISSIDSHLRKYPNDVDAHIVRGWVAFSSKDFKTAEQSFLTVKSQQADSSIAEYYLRQARVQNALNSGTMKEF